MEKKSVLFINACVRPQSRTYRLAQQVLRHLEGEVEQVALYQQQIPLLDLPTLELREAGVHAGDYSHALFDLAKQFAAADTIVLAAPYWDLLFPAVVRSYLEAVTVSGLTFRYTPQGFPEGLCRAKKLIYVTTAGGPIMGKHLGFEYVKTMAQTFYGIRQVQYFDAQGLDIVGADAEKIMEAACAAVDAAFAQKN